MRIGGRESRSLGIEGHLLSISRSGEMAVKLGGRIVPWGLGALAQVSLSGGAARELLRDVVVAEWDLEGRDLAVVRHVNGRARLEYPIGKVLSTSPQAWRTRSLSPLGQHCPFRTPARRDATLGRHGRGPTRTPQGALSRLAGHGERRVVRGKPRALVRGLAPRGDLALQAVDLSGRVRLVARVPGLFWALDVDPQGRVLVCRGVERIVAMALPPGESRERDVSALDWSTVVDLSADGHTSAPRGGERRERQRGLLEADGSLACRAPGRGCAEHHSLRMGNGPWPCPRKATSPAFSCFRPVQAKLASFGTPRSRPSSMQPGPLMARRPWSPQARKGADRGSTCGGWMTGRQCPYPWRRRGAQRDRVAGPAGGWRRGGATSGLVLLPLGGGDPRRVPGREEGDAPRRFSADGRGLFVERAATLPARVVDRIDLQTGGGSSGRRSCLSIQPG